MVQWHNYINLPNAQELLRTIGIVINKLNNLEEGGISKSLGFNFIKQIDKVTCNYKPEYLKMEIIFIYHFKKYDTHYFIKSLVRNKFLL